MAETKVILVTGSNTGIGFELVRLLAEKGHIVYIGARNEIAGRGAQQTLNADGLTNVKFVLIDVNNHETVKHAGDEIERTEGRLDVLVNNAAISKFEDNQHPSSISESTLREVMETNFFGLVLTTTVFVPLMRKSSAPVILNVSSALGSNTVQSHTAARLGRPVVAYRASKAAVNAYTIALSQELQSEGFRVNTITPGLVSSKINDFAEEGKSLKEGALSLLPFTLLDKDGPTGKFFDWEGKEMPW
ncbi:Short-chain dehydrogenase [Psilocybe cubensis]|uniref:Short-chain dehydrogenase n=2 Tax=Psilocybe cubensis TaxID=181762 RepID=A0ACB8GXK7_PSICU|nr:Short-chain dehydrogenase [Psilocybe cubensis]KAH9480368.1 Short-chain dehydrogenase [Psilocybe cubensis]